MGIRLPQMLVHAKLTTKGRNQLSSSKAGSAVDVPKGHFVIYVGEREKKRFVIPISYLNQPLFQDLLRKAEDEFGFDHPMGRLTIPCREDEFISLTSHLNRL